MTTGRFSGFRTGFRAMGRMFVGVALLLPLVGLLTMAGGAAEAAGTVNVSVVDFAYSPGTITIRAGTTVQWTNTGNQQHTVTSSDGAFESSGYLVPNTTAKSYSFTFTEPGMYSYFCIPHTFMLGTVIVEPEPTATPLALPTRRAERTLPPPRPTPLVILPTHPRPTPIAPVAGNTPTPTPQPAPMHR